MISGLCIAAELMASHNSLDPAAAARNTNTAADARFPAGAATAAVRQQQVLVDQLQQQQQQQQQQQRFLSSLGGILSSGLPVNANQLQVLITCSRLRVEECVNDVLYSSVLFCSFFFLLALQISLKYRGMKEIRSRIEMGEQVFMEKTKLFTSKVYLELKKRI